MLADCPDPREVADFHFLQLRTLKIPRENESVPSKCGNLLASASKYGLLFIGIEGGFKVIKLDDVLTLDEDKENRSTEKNYPYSFVSSGTPIFLATNCSQTTLAACVRSASGILIHLYSLSAFSDLGGAAWQPFCSNTLSSSAIEVQDFSWNPALEGLYAFCLSDGSLHIHEVNGNSIKQAASLQAANTVSVCWSPKGKQLVAGKRNGSFSQYKPTLQEVKTIAPPPFEGSPVAVTSLCWISTTVFAVLYVSDDTPNLFIVSAPKDSAVVYTNFNDVCLGNNSFPAQRYFLHLEPLWGILVCASLDSIEVAVLGDMPNWVQWDLKEDGKALLPGKDGATHAVGMAVLYSAQNQIVISESESYPPMPVMFLLTNNGLLVSFHMINAKSDAATLVSPPLPVEIKNSAASGFSAASAVENIPNQLPSSGMLPMSSTFVVEKVSVANQIPPSQVKTPENISIPTGAGLMKNSAFSSPDQFKQPSHPFGTKTPMNSLDVASEATAVRSVQKTQERTQANKSTLFSPVEKQNEVQTSPDNSYMLAILSEIQSFTKELQELKQLQNSAPAIDGEEDMIHLKIFALNLQNFQNDISETMQSLSSDIYTLKNVLLESFVMVEEACSRERRKNDHSYITMLKERALDPITAKRMQKMNQHYQYLRTQLQEVSDRLDQDWIHLISNRKKSIRHNPCISSSEAIYKTIVNNQKIIHNLKKKVDELQKKAEEKKLRNTTKSGVWGKHHRRSMQEDLSKLADEFLDVKIGHPEEGEQPTIGKKLSTESQNFLKAFLKESSVITVRPTAVYSPSQSRLLSNAVPSEDFSACRQDKDASSRQTSTLSPPEKEVSAGAAPPANKSPAPEMVGPLTTPAKSTSGNEGGFESHVPVYEPVSPPETVNAPPPMNKTFITSHALVTPLSKEKGPKPCDTQPSFSMAVNSSVVEKESTNQDYSSKVPASVEGNRGPTIISPSPGTKFATFSHVSTGMAGSVPTSYPLPPTAWQVVVPAPPGSAASKSPSVIAVVSSAPNSENKSPLGSVCPVTVSITESKNTVILGSSHKISPMCLTLSGASGASLTSQVSNVSLPMAVVSQTPTSVIMAPVLAKSSTPLSMRQTLPQFQKLSDTFDQSGQLEKGESLAVSGRPSDANANFSLNLSDRTCVDSKSPSRQEPSIEGQKPIPSFISISETASNISKTDNLPVTSSQLNASSLPDLKHPESSNTPASKPPVIFSSVTLESTAPQPVTVVSSVPSMTSAASFIPQPEPTASKSPPSMPTLTPETTSANSLVSLFGQNVTVCSPTSVDNNSNDVKKTEPLAFGIKTTLFGKSSETPFFNTSTATTTAAATAATVTTTTEAPTFGQVPVTQPAPVFGQPSNFTSTSEGFFSQTPTFGVATTAATAVTSSDANNQASAFSFGKPVFGQTTGSFGLAKSFFGQNSTPATQAATSPSFSFGQNSNLGFGQGSFFGGLGGKPSEENASKNVFGISSAVKPPDAGNLFRNSGVTSFGAVNSGSSFTGSGSFSSGGGSVAQSGFGAFQQQPVVQQQQPGGFGAAPAFGSTPAFGSAPAFGSTPTFGSGGALSSVFGQQQVSSNFSNFANASSPTFGSLASQSPGFSSPSLGTGGSGGGGGGFGSPTFGSLSFNSQPSGFGSPGSPPSNSSAFTQWRN